MLESRQIKEKPPSKKAVSRKKITTYELVKPQQPSRPVTRSRKGAGIDDVKNKPSQHKTSASTRNLVFLPGVSSFDDEEEEQELKSI